VVDQDERRGAFWFAWWFMVFVVSIGFFIQAQTIRRLAEDERSHAAQVERVQARTTTNAEHLCALLVEIADPEDATVIITVFRNLGYSCTA
jgi:cytochrome c biogenesis protein ResB